MQVPVMNARSFTSVFLPPHSVHLPLPQPPIGSRQILVKGSGQEEALLGMRYRFMSEDSVGFSGRLLELIHSPKERQRIDRKIERLTAKLAVGALDVEDDARGLRPARIRAEIHPLGSLQGRQALREESLRFSAHVLEICLHLPRSLDAAEWAVARNDDLRAERDDRVERGDPLVVRTLPTDRSAAAEENIPREYDSLVWEMYDYVAGRVRGPDVEKLRSHPVEVEDQPIVDQPRRWPELDAGEIPVGELPPERRESGILAVSRRAHRLQHRGAF